MIITLQDSEVRKILMEAIESRTDFKHGTVGEENFYISVTDASGEVNDIEAVQAVATFHDTEPSS